MPHPPLVRSTRARVCPRSESKPLPSLARTVAPLPRDEQVRIAALARAGDGKAAETLLLSWQPAILAEARRFGRKQDRDDRFQAGLVAALEAVRLYDPARGASSPLSLALTRVRQRHVDGARSRDVEREHVQVVEDARLARMADRDGAETGPRFLGEVRAIERLAAALEQLPDRQREVLALRFAEGLGHAEAGRRLAAHPTTIARLEERALAALRAAVEGTPTTEERGQVVPLDRIRHEAPHGFEGSSVSSCMRSTASFFSHQ